MKLTLRKEERAKNINECEHSIEEKNNTNMRLHEFTEREGLPKSIMGLFRDRRILKVTKGTVTGKAF